jgi:hypothetical protein
MLVEGLSIILVEELQIMLVEGLSIILVEEVLRNKLAFW